MLIKQATFKFQGNDMTIALMDLGEFFVDRYMVGIKAANISDCFKNLEDAEKAFDQVLKDAAAHC